MKVNDKICGRCAYMAALIDGSELLGECTDCINAVLKVKRVCRRPENNGDVISYDYSCKNFMHRDEVLRDYVDSEALASVARANRSKK